MANTNESLSLEAIVNRHFSTESQESPATPVTTTGTTKAPETPVASARNKAVRKQPAETVDPEDEDPDAEEISALELQLNELKKKKRRKKADSGVAERRAVVEGGTTAAPLRRAVVAEGGTPLTPLRAMPPRASAKLAEKRWKDVLAEGKHGLYR